MTDPADLRLIDPHTGFPVDETLFEGVPKHLEIPFRNWAAAYLAQIPGLADRLALRLRRPPLRSNLLGFPPADLLTLISFALQMTTDRLELDADQREHATWDDSAATAQVARLQDILTDGGSAFTVSWDDPVQLIRRLDSGVATGIGQTLATADTTATTFLRQALRHAYGLQPDPGGAYADAVRAVEHLTGPLILPNNTEPSLGQATSHLEQAPGKWQFALTGKDGDDSPEPVTKLMRRLVGGQVSRHAGGTRNRAQTQAEAEAAVQVAVLLVQLLSTGALTRRETP
jgi:hypothetical protein